jgi:hypothetical protein
MRLQEILRPLLSARKSVVTRWRRPVLCGVRTILLIVLVLLLIGVLPTWDYSSSWGYRPLGGVGLVLLVIIVLALLGKI